jgi:hypothetical protein
MKKLLILFTFLFSFSVFSESYTTVDTFNLSTGIFTSQSFKVKVEKREDGIYASTINEDRDLKAEVNSFTQLKEDLYLLEIFWKYSTIEVVYPDPSVGVFYTYDIEKKGLIYMYYSNFAELLDVEHVNYSKGLYPELEEIHVRKKAEAKTVDMYRPIGWHSIQ